MSKPRAGTITEEVMQILAASNEPLDRHAIYALSQMATEVQQVSRALSALKVSEEIVEVDQVPAYGNLLIRRYAIPGSAAAGEGKPVGAPAKSPRPEGAGKSVRPKPVVPSPIEVATVLRDIADTVSGAPPIAGGAPALHGAAALHEAALRPDVRSDDPAPRSPATPDMRFGVFDDGSLEIWSGADLLCRFDADVVERIGALLARYAK
jgi:hypothetical protein